MTAMSRMQLQSMCEEIEVSAEDTACVEVPNGLDNEVYFVSEDSYGLYCENISVLIINEIQGDIIFPFEGGSRKIRRLHGKGYSYYIKEN